MTVLDEFTVVVYNHADMVSAVSNSYAFNHIYLGANVELTGRIDIDQNKDSLIIDGTYEEVRYRLTDRDSFWADDAFGIRSASDIQLTFQNIDITGRNYYGIPYIYEGVNTSNLTLIYNNVTYSGPQLTHNQNGLTRYIDCDITITPSQSSEAQEVGEVNRIELGGTIRIQHSSTNQTRAVFWFHGSTATMHFTVLQNADVEVNTGNYFMYNADHFWLTPYPVPYVIESGAKFTLNAGFGISYTNIDRTASFLVEENASFIYTQQAANSTYSSLYINGTFTIMGGARVYMQANFANAHPLLQFTENANSIEISNPKSFVLYNNTSAVFGFSYALLTPVPKSFTISGGQLNYWTTPAALANAGGFTDIPQDKWHKPDWSSFTINGRIEAAGTTVTGSTFTAGELEDLPALNLLQLQSARVLSIGDLLITANPIISGSDITGWTEAAANVLIQYNINGTGYSVESTADESGRFTITPPVSIPVGTVVTITANTPFLITQITGTAIAAGEFDLISAPVHIAFNTPVIVSGADTFLRRYYPNNDEPIIVSDSRAISSSWNLLVSITGNLQTDEMDVLENSLVFRKADGELITLSENPVVIFTGEPNEGVTKETTITWDVSEGILLHATSPIRTWTEYSTNLIWDLQII